VPPAEEQARVAQLIDRVGLPTDAAARYPSGLSGGQVRRVAIARALASEPSVLVADEAVSGLDVSTQAQLLTLLRGLQRDMGLTLVFITHDLGVASYLCEEIAIMYLGRIVETGPTDAVLNQPAHPYSAALRAAAHAGIVDLGCPQQFVGADRQRGCQAWQVIQRQPALPGFQSAQRGDVDG